MDDEELQTIFDTVITHLRSQGAKALDPDGDCQYRAEQLNGEVLKCAVGCLIKDSQYTDQLEGEDASHNLVIEKVSNSLEIEPEDVPVDLLYDLQNCHDDYPVEGWEKRFKEIATLYNLRVPE